MTLKWENITLYTGTGEKLTQSAIVVEDGKIVATGQEAVQMAASETIDGQGKVILPGLFDMHIHLGMDGDADPFAEMAKETQASSAFRHQANALKQLQSGVTSVRNLGSKWHVDLAYRNAVNTGLLTGPTVYGSGQPIVMTGGHGYPMASEADGEDEVRKAARQTLKQGADVLKLMATGGVMTPGVDPGSPQLSEKEMRAAVEEALHAGKTTASHAQGTQGIQNAVRAGITTIEHGIFLDDETIELMIEYGTVLVPTLAAPYYIVQNADSGAIPPHAVKKAIFCLDAHQESFRKAVKAGVKIAAGTDAGTPFNLHGDFAKELELMHECGMPIRDIITSATYQAASALNVQDQSGSLEKGKVADFIVLSEDPEDNISAFRSVDAVYKGGTLVHDHSNRESAYTK
ncbi:metal-dependent hydrolase family protein [Planococcus glaciei]|uniref:metal-dependent hydrolase family protein n=1 Tax=Planococcus glaciei TaxID=459472 RepID=UPI0008820B97|nr:amidohydrolase family protein [Planococcus glaciei]MBX0315705.1 amidohydrolase family protein [Planococcus glaciei]SDG94406.1 Imidazolonepropionase [Planococcus glaciei]